MRKLDERRYISLVLLIIIIILLMLATSYLSKHWEDWFGPKAEKFCEFDVINQEEEFINNKTYYKVNFKLTALKNMYLVEISTKNSSGITRITSLNEELPITRTIQAGTTVYPTMTVQLDNDKFYGQVEMQISFIDVDGHEKYTYKTVRIGKVNVPGFEAIFTIAGLFAIVYILRKRR